MPILGLPFDPAKLGHHALVEGVPYYTGIGNDAEHDAVGVISRSAFEITRAKAKSEDRIHDSGCLLNCSTENERPARAEKAISLWVFAVPIVGHKAVDALSLSLKRQVAIGLMTAFSRRRLIQN